MWLTRKKYVPQLPDFLALCERNYAQLNRLLPSDRIAGAAVELSLSDTDHYRICIREVAPFTTTVLIEMLQDGAHPYSPAFEVRLYHDAQLAEVVSCQQRRAFQAVYQYPNATMHQPDEKRQINLLLRDWLQLCLGRGFCFNVQYCH